MLLLFSGMWSFWELQVLLECCGLTGKLYLQPEKDIFPSGIYYHTVFEHNGKNNVSLDFVQVAWLENIYIYTRAIWGRIPKLLFLKELYFEHRH